MCVKIWQGELKNSGLPGALTLISLLSGYKYEWALEYPQDGFDEDGSYVEARHLGLDGLDAALQQPRDARVSVNLQKKK